MVRSIWRRFYGGCQLGLRRTARSFEHLADLAFLARSARSWRARRRSRPGAAATGPARDRPPGATCSSRSARSSIAGALFPAARTVRPRCERRPRITSSSSTGETPRTASAKSKHHHITVALRPRSAAACVETRRRYARARPCRCARPAGQSGRCYRAAGTTRADAVSCVCVHDLAPAGSALAASARCAPPPRASRRRSRRSRSGRNACRRTGSKSTPGVAATPASSSMRLAKSRLSSVKRDTSA